MVYVPTWLWIMQVVESTPVDSELTIIVVDILIARWKHHFLFCQLVAEYVEHSLHRRGGIG